MKKVYITGASGFIGRNLKPRLGESVSISHENILKTDFSNATSVFFCSAYGNMSHHTDSSKIVQANVIDLAHVLSQINWKLIDTFVFISTSSVKLKVQTMYSRTKKAAEEILLSYMEKHDAPISIIRPFSVTGVGEQSNHLIPLLIESCVANKPMKFVPEPKHDFIDIKDLVDGILSLSNNRARGIFELGSGTSYSNQEVLNMVENATGKKANVTVTQSLRPYDTEDWVSRNFKSRVWGWYPRIPLEVSIKNMVGAYVK